MSSSFEPGTIVAERYRVDKKLGQGGAGAIYRGTQLGLGRGVAIKVLHAEKDSQINRDRFDREAHILAALRHPGAVQIFDFGHHEGRAYIVMELLLGESLQARVARARPERAECLRIAREIADVLVATHEINLVHRDLKPDNVFLEEPDQEGSPDRVKVVDFGLAFIAEQGDLGRLTRDGLVSGTPQYVSPEQAGDRALTPASDIYSFGVMFYRLLTGALPFTGSLGELVSAHLYAPVPRLSARIEVNPKIDALVQQMMAKRPEDRPSARDVRALLDDALSGDLDVGDHLGPRAAQDREARALPVEDTTEADTLVGLDMSPKEGRAARQLAEIPKARVTTRDLTQGPSLLLHVRGPIESAVIVALARAGIELCTEDEAMGVLLVDPTVDEISTLSNGNRPVLVAAPAGDLEAATEYLRVGAADLITKPLVPDQVARKVERALKRGRRET